MRTGRPPSNNPKHISTKIRMTDNDHKMLNYLCDKLGKSKSEIMRAAILHLYYRAKWTGLESEEVK